MQDTIGISNTDKNRALGLSTFAFTLRWLLSSYCVWLFARHNRNMDRTLYAPVLFSCRFSNLDALGDCQDDES